VFALFPFSNLEIDVIFLDFPNDKAPRLDGFNGHFVSITWHIIKQEFYTIGTNFFHHEANIKSLNYFYNTLVPKKENPECVNDFRPISCKSDAKVIPPNCS